MNTQNTVTVAKNTVKIAGTGKPKPIKNEVTITKEKLLKERAKIVAQESKAIYSKKFRGLGNYRKIDIMNILGMSNAGVYNLLKRYKLTKNSDGTYPALALSKMLEVHRPAQNKLKKLSINK